MLAAASAQPAVRGPGLAASRRKATWLPNAAILFAKRLKLDRGHFLIPHAGPQHGHPTGAQEAPQEVEMAELAPSAGTAGSAAPAPASAGAAAHEPAAAVAVGPVLVAFRVPSCQLAYGEHLRLVGSCPELGAWSAGVAPALRWRQGDVWEGQVALPPGQHALKLVRCRGNGVELAWEAGANRTLRVPELAVSAQSSARRCPALSVTCRWDDTPSTEVVADRAHLQAVADAAAARVADLMRRKAELAARLACLEAEVLESEVRIANTAAGAERLVNAELARQVGQRRQRAQRLELAAAAAELQAEQRSAAALPSQSLSGSRGQQQRAGGAVAAFIGTALASAAASVSGVAAPASSQAAATAGLGSFGGAVAQFQANSDGSLQFCFADSGAEEGSHQPSALELAKARLAARLPATAAAALEHRLSRMDAAGAGSLNSRHSTGRGRSSGSSSAPSSPRELLSTAVSAAGLVGAAGPGPTHQRLARKVTMLRQEVAAGARQAADLSDQFELLLSLGTPASQKSSSSSNRSVEKGAHSSGSGSGSSSRAGLQTQQHGRRTQPASSAAAHSTAVAPTSTAAGPAAAAAAAPATAAAGSAPAVPAVHHQSPTHAGKTSSGLAPANGDASARQNHSRHSSVRARAKAAVRVAAVAAPVAPASATGRQLGANLAHHTVDATARGSFPVAAAWVAAEAVFTAGTLVWGAGRSVVPRPARGAADAAFWVGYAALAAIPLLS